MADPLVSTFERRCAPLRRSQRGASLLFSLMALVALALAAVALVRSVDTGGQVIGNLGFKIDTTAASDHAAEQAIQWLRAQTPGTLNADAAGYSATSLDALDPTGSQTGMAGRVVIDWTDDGCASQGAFTACRSASDVTTANGNTAKYFITRLCATAGAPEAAGNTCVVPLQASGSVDSNRSAVDYSKPFGFDSVVLAPYYRIIVRTTGGRSTASFTETIVHF